MQEFCNGGSVRSLLCRGAFAQQDMTHTWATIMHAAKGIAAGMQYVHGKRICHGDLNPSNVLLKVCSRLQFQRTPINLRFCSSPHSVSLSTRKGSDRANAANILTGTEEE